MSDKKGKKPIQYKKLEALCEKIETYTYEERIKILELHPDRADVIVPASKIVLTVMKTANIHEMIVPQIGMTDGIIHQLYEGTKKRKRKTTSRY